MRFLNNLSVIVNIVFLREEFGVFHDSPFSQVIFFNIKIVDGVDDVVVGNNFLISLFSFYRSRSIIL